MATYAALRLYVDSWRWDGVPFYVRAGKSPRRRPRPKSIVELKNPPQVVFNEPTPPMGNYVRFRLSPQVVIALGARAKRPGEGMIGRAGGAVGRRQGRAAATSGRMDAYERLLGDAMPATPRCSRARTSSKRPGRSWIRCFAASPALRIRAR